MLSGPVIADISRQILMLEVAYAAFCGIGYLLVPGPKLHHGSMHSEGTVYYARAIQDALNLGPYIQFHIWLRTIDNPENEVDQMGDLAPLAHGEFLEPEEDATPKMDPFGTWEAWDLIRRTCKYHARLLVGKNGCFSASHTMCSASFFNYLSSRTKLTFDSSLHPETSSAYVRPVPVAF